MCDPRGPTVEASQLLHSGSQTRLIGGHWRIALGWGCSRIRSWSHSLGQLDFGHSLSRTPLFGRRGGSPGPSPPPLLEARDVAPAVRLSVNPPPVWLARARESERQQQVLSRGGRGYPVQPFDQDSGVSAHQIRESGCVKLFEVGKPIKISMIDWDPPRVGINDRKAWTCDF